MQQLESPPPPPGVKRARSLRLVVFYVDFSGFVVLLKTYFYITPSGIKLWGGAEGKTMCSPNIFIGLVLDPYTLPPIDDK